MVTYGTPFYNFPRRFNLRLCVPILHKPSRAFSWLELGYDSKSWIKMAWLALSYICVSGVLLQTNTSILLFGGLKASTSNTDTTKAITQVTLMNVIILLSKVSGSKIAFSSM